MFLADLVSKLASTLGDLLKQGSDVEAIDVAASTKLKNLILTSPAVRCSIGLFVIHAINTGKGLEMVEDLKAIARSIDKNRLFVENLVPFMAQVVEEGLLEKYGITKEFLKKHYEGGY